MAERGTKEVLLRLRRAQEVECKRALVVKRAARAEARRQSAAAEATRRELEKSIASAIAQRSTWTAERRAGRLARDEAFEGSLRNGLVKARASERRCMIALDAAEDLLHEAQRALADAMRARQRSESFAATERTNAARARERREHGETEGRYRGTTRS